MVPEFTTYQNGESHCLAYSLVGVLGLVIAAEVVMPIVGSASFKINELLEQVGNTLNEHIVTLLFTSGINNLKF